MVPEIAASITGLALLAFIGWAAFWLGKDASQRAAFYTISSLRRELSSTRLELERAREQNRKLMRHVNTARNVSVEVPAWME